MNHRVLFLSCLCAAAAAGFSRAADDKPAALPQAAPADAGMDAGRLARIDDVVEGAIKRGQLPGAVVLVARDGKVVFRKTYGSRSKQPADIPMTPDTVFDLASLTKPLATATPVMLLLERGKLRLTDPAAQYVPEFGRNGKDKITLEQLLLHTSGLIADNSVNDYADGPRKAFERIHELTPTTEPGSRFVYSDVGFMVLGEIVERVSGESLDAFAHKNVFAPLGLRETTFKPGKELAGRAAPTEKRGDRWIQGEVHDPRSFLLGGVAGHAGLFSTADEVAVYAQMLLNGGSYAGKRVLSPATVRLMTTARPVPGGQRALGWDVDTRYSSNRGELFGAGSFGHTGFTGTSVWVDPPSRTVVVFLSNRVHPEARTNINQLRGQVATLAAAAIVAPPFPEKARPAPAEPRQPLGQGLQTLPQQGVLTGIDVLKRDGFQALKGRRVGLVTNHTGRDRDGASTIDLLHKAEGVKLVTLFSPEHGIRGVVDAPVPDGKDEKAGLPVYSLYGQRKRPTAEQLQGIDTLVYDIQDIGCRFYTYLTTLGYILETAAEHKLKVVVLDRPNPIGGVAVEGPVLDKTKESFVGYHPLPVRHGLTLGELAGLFNRERKINADLQVIRVEGWKRDELWDRTSLVWVNPSPNMRSLAAALLYPGVGLLETTNLSVGRGTDRPFEVIGAPWLDGRRLAEALARHDLPGVRFVPTRFTPSSSTHAGKECGGVQIYLDDWKRFQSLPTGMAIAHQLRLLYPNDWQMRRYDQLLAHPPTFAAVERGDAPEKVVESWKPELEAFLAVRKEYLLYK
jgi:uncharacterized protein YbbC (DUF1343 family)/CubicO group peptidase (beta-lactamase class C family)